MCPLCASVRPKELQDRTRTNHGLQLWAALPARNEEVEPAFFHTPAERFPIWEKGGVTLRVLVGSAFELTSPVWTLAENPYLDMRVNPGYALTLAPVRAERAIYSADHAVGVDGALKESGITAVLGPDVATIAAPDGAH